MADWVAMDTAWWPMVAEGLARGGSPWEREAALADLRWWDHQRRRGLEQLPGRPALAARWRRSEHWVRCRLAEAGEWRDPVREVAAAPHRVARGRLAGGHRPVANTSPARRQDVASRSPAADRANADDSLKSARTSPAGRQDVASRSPAGRQPRAHVGGDAAARGRGETTDLRPQTSLPHTPAQGGGSQGRARQRLVGDQRQAWVDRIADLLTRHWLGADVLTRASERHAGLLDLVLGVLGRSGARPEGVRRSELADVLAEAAEQVRASGAALPIDPSEIELARVMADLDGVDQAELARVAAELGMVKADAADEADGWASAQAEQLGDDVEDDVDDAAPSPEPLDPVQEAIVAELGGDGVPALPLAIRRVRDLLGVLEEVSVAVDDAGRPTPGGVRLLGERLRLRGRGRPPDDALADAAVVALRVRQLVAA